jgi:ABC-type transport system involved in multi-copper enzyme maturation permease subunit
MTTATTHRSTVPPGRDGFTQLVRSEWTKLRTVPRWTVAVLAIAGLTVMFSLFASGASSSGYYEFENVVAGPDGQPVTDAFHVHHRPLTGDGSITTRVVAQHDSHAWAKAGVIIKEDLAAGSPYAAMMVTPDHGVRMQSDFTTDVAGSAHATPRWLKLTRSGTTIAGYESADGRTWDEVGTVDLGSLSRTVQVGLFVASPDVVGPVERDVEGSIVYETGEQVSTIGTATFDGVRVDGAQPAGAQLWSDANVGEPADAGGTDENAGTFTVTGSGDIAAYDNGFDLVQTSLGGASVGMVVAIALSVLFMTSEYKHRMIRTTFTASPRRGAVLAAKAVVIGGTTFAAALAANVVAFRLGQPRLQANGFAVPGADPLSLADPPALRAVVGTAAVIALVAVLSLSAGAITRHSGAAITGVSALLVVPAYLEAALPFPAAMWVTRITPRAGFAIRQTIERYDTAIGPWAGLGVLCAYTAAAFTIALWLVRRRDA